MNYLKGFSSIAIFLSVWTIAIGVAADKHSDAVKTTAKDSKLKVTTNESFRSSSTSTCPTALAEWVRSDYYNQRSGSYSTYEKTKYCEEKLDQYMPRIRRPLAQPRTQPTGTATQPPGTAESSVYVRNLLSEKFSKKINSSYKKAISQCDDLSPEAAWETQTKFYAVATKFEKTNSSILEEVAYIDSVLPSVSGVLNHFNCPSQIWPAQQARCQALQARSTACWKDKKSRMQSLVEKTKEKLKSIKNLENLYAICIAKLGRENPSATNRNYMEKMENPIVQQCLPFSEAIELEKNSIPWVRGAEFGKIATLQPADPRRAKIFPTYSLDSGVVEQAIEKQLRLDKNALVAAYAENMDSFRCLSSESKGSVANCDYRKIQKQLQLWPDQPQEAPFYSETISPSAATNPDSKISDYFEAEKCLWEKGDDRIKKEESMQNTAINISLMAATFVGGELLTAPRLLMGSVPSVGLGIETATGLTRLQRILSVGSFTGSALYSGYEVQKAFKICVNEANAKQLGASEPAAGNSKQKLVSTELACVDERAMHLQAKEKKDECMVRALVATASLAPMLGALPSFRRALKSPPSQSPLSPAPAPPPQPAAVTPETATESVAETVTETISATTSKPVTQVVSRPAAQLVTKTEQESIEKALRKLQLGSSAAGNSLKQLVQRKINLSRSTTHTTSEYSEAKKMVDGIVDYISSPKLPDYMGFEAALALIRWSRRNITEKTISLDVFKMFQGSLYDKVYRNHELNNDIRFMLYHEMLRLDDIAMEGLNMTRPFMTEAFEFSTTIRSENIMQFLDKDIRKMSLDEIETASTVREIFRYVSDGEKKEIFNSIMAGKGVPAKYSAVEKAAGRWPPEGLDPDSGFPSLLSREEYAAHFGKPKPRSQPHAQPHAQPPLYKQTPSPTPAKPEPDATDVAFLKLKLATKANDDSLKQLAQNKINLSGSTTHTSTEYSQAEKMVRGMTDYISDPKTPEFMSGEAALALLRWSHLNITEKTISPDIFKMIQGSLYDRIYRNHELSDEIRFMLYLEMKRLDQVAIQGLKGVRPITNERFEKAAEIKKENVIPFLGKDIRKMKLEEVETAITVEAVFRYVSDREKKEIFNSVMAGRGVPSRYVAVEKAAGRWPPKDYLDPNSEFPSLLSPEEYLKQFGKAKPPEAILEPPIPLVRRPPESTLFKPPNAADAETEHYYFTRSRDWMEIRPAPTVRAGGRSALDEALNLNVLPKMGFGRQEVPNANGLFTIYVHPKTKGKIVVPVDPNHRYTQRELLEIQAAVLDGREFYSDAFKKWVKGKFNAPDGAP